ncbi:uncharacterized protein [Elaeis guineensis]|uniref:uncharacterized protein isoform X2 n=1 Tax=Elaeis guineensis var. tenera TaxID=51953 RepID=UPI003C6CD37D
MEKATALMPTILSSFSNVKKERRKKPDPSCVVCNGSGRVDCHYCQGRGRTNCVHQVMLPKENGQNGAMFVVEVDLGIVTDALEQGNTGI